MILDFPKAVHFTLQPQLLAEGKLGAVTSTQAGLCGLTEANIRQLPPAPSGPVGLFQFLESAT